VPPACPFHRFLIYHFPVAKKPIFDLTCPCCSAVLKVDPETEAVISHVAPVKPKTFNDLDEAARALKEQDSRRDSIFRQSVEAQKHASDLLEKKFQVPIFGVIAPGVQTALKQTRNYCTLEFRAGADGHLVDVGTVTVQTTMTMQGEPMTGATTDPKRVDTGRYTVEMVLAMTGTWRISIAWDGPEGKGAVTFPADVAGSL